MKSISGITIFITILLLKQIPLQAQFENTEQTVYFQSRIDNPIKVEVHENNGKYQFTAYNRSFYPYQLELIFKNVSNMSPMLNHTEYILLPGQTNLISMSIVDRNHSAYYDYSVKYSIGLPCQNVDYEYPWLIPVKNKFDLVFDSYDASQYYQDFFKLSQGDTVFNMRKGYVTAIPDMYYSSDRISDNTSLEIMHDDGTIMIYKNISPDLLFVKAGEAIYPGQPLGIINDQLVLKIRLYMNEGNGKLKNLTIHYSLGDNKTEKFSPDLPGRKIVYPMEVITREMSKRDKNRYLKGTLYK